MADANSRTITKKELVNRIAGTTGQTKVVVKEVLQQFLDEIIGELANGNRLEFREFGVFEIRERAARNAQNPKTLEKVFVPSKRVVKFKVGRTMRQRVCEEPQFGQTEVPHGAPSSSGQGSQNTPKTPPAQPPANPGSPF